MVRGRKGNRLPPFVALPWDLLNSEAYKALPPAAGKALPYFLGKVKVICTAPEWYIIEFSFSYTEARKYGFAIGTHSRNISRLMQNGFIDPVYRGGKKSFGMSSSVFKLSTRWKDYGSPNFKTVSWQEIMPEFKKQKPTPKMEPYNTKNGVGDSDRGGVDFQN